MAYRDLNYLEKRMEELERIEHDIDHPKKKYPTKPAAPASVAAGM